MRIVAGICRITIGALVSAELEDNLWAACISAIASGTFLYSAVVEVLGNEMRKECFDAGSIHRTMRARVCKLVAFITGFAAMCIVSKFT